MPMLDALTMLCASFQSMRAGVQAGSDVRFCILFSCVGVQLLVDVDVMSLPEVHTPGAEDCAHGWAR